MYVAVLQVLDAGLDAVVPGPDHAERVRPHVRRGLFHRFPTTA